MGDQPSTGDSAPPAAGAASATGTTQGNAAPDWYNNPPEWLKNLQPPAASTENKTATNPNAGNGSGTGPMSTLIDAINALPEKILNGMKETAPPAQTAEQTAATSATSAAATNAGHEGAPAGVNKGAGDRFRDWWFKG